MITNLLNKESLQTQKNTYKSIHGCGIPQLNALNS